MMRAIFFQVRTAQEKLNRIIETAHFHFSRKEHLLFLTENDQALQYIDTLLWSSPKESFLPHRIIAEPSDELIAATKEKINLTKARAIFNLCVTPLFIEAPCIYDFEDLSSPNKQMLSQVRFNAYKSAHFLIESRTSLES